MAPELYKDEGHDEKPEIFSFALVFYVTVAGRPAVSPRLTFPQICQKLKIRDERPVIPAALEPFVAALIPRGWSTNPTEPPSFKEIFEGLRSQVSCVVRDEFNHQNVDSYITWIGGSVKP